MDNRQSLENLSKNFSRENLTLFLRAASGKFKPEKADYSHYLEKANFVKNLQRLGQIEFDDSRRMIVLVGELDKELTSQSGKLRQYEVAKQVLKQENLDAGIFVFHDNAGHFRFSWITAQYTGARREFSSFRRYTYFVSPELPAHTFVEQIGKADFTSVEKITEAFSVEPVTKEFFRQFREIFEEAEATIKLKWSDEKKRLYTQRFFNRVLFITFLERKGWLTFNGRKDYLKALFADYFENTRDKNANFHRSRLNTLFFMGLNYPSGDKRLDAAYKPILSLIGDVPYLNGGLFEAEEDDKDGPYFSDDVIKKVLTELVYQFNFTVTESTPLDVEVAVDPEMLGRIFEELVTGRHESGSYYTPKPVVAFMCREALKGYLGTALPNETQEALALFVDKNDASGLKNPELSLNALRVVKVCDPACGSGAYLLGMLHELLEQRECLFVASKLDARNVYDRKLEIIQNNLYGVDKDDFAVNIARLRLWLSLIVDYEGETPPPLPNLDFKIETGDSLTAPDPSGGLNLGFRSQLVDDFLLAKNQFTTAHHSEKKELKEQVNKLRDDIKAWSGRKTTFNGFDWTIEFAEIFIKPAAKTTMTGALAGLVNTSSGQMELAVMPLAKTGFDVILANPPYVRADAQFKHIEDEKERQRQIAEWKTFRKRLKDSKIYKTLHEKWDLFIPFLERAYQLLRQNGQMVFIIPDAYNAAKYTSKSHAFFLQNTSIERIDFCSEINLFDAGVSNTILHFTKSIPSHTHVPMRVRRWGNRDEFEKNIEVLATNAQVSFDEPLFKFESSINQYSDKYLPLGQVVYVSYGLRANADDNEWLGEFKTEDCVSPKKDKTHPKPFVQGKDITKWAKKRIWYLEWGTERAPGKFSRPTFIELQQAKPKLMAMKNSGAEPVVIYDEDMTFFDATIVGFVPWHILENVVNKSINKTSKYKHQDPLGNRETREMDSRKFQIKYLLAVLNSTFAKRWIDKKRRHKVSIYPDDWKQLPIAPISLEEQMEFVKLVDKILGEYEKQGHPLPEKSVEKVREWEGQLDEMVRKLYE
ncbi:MAG: Eco57I restriction-modification methylase domain-containing protein [Anaerolineales bacterium]|nr:MAG: Eco57I restriction-modification methylase domain-containing protein [Anaerolineales bacterium]